MSAGRQGAQFLLLFFLTPFVVQTLGDEGYGVWTLALSALGFLALLDLGLSLAVVRLVARAAESTSEERNRRLSTVFAFFLLLSGVALLVTLGVASWLSRDQGIPPELRELAFTLVCLLGLRHGVLLLPLSFFRGVVFGAKRFRLLNATQLSASIIQGVGTWFVLSSGGGLVGLACLHLGCMLGEHLIYFIATRAALPDLKLRFGLVDRKVLPELASFSGWTVLGSVAGLILLRTDPLIVKSALPLAAVTAYGVALKITEALLLVLKQAVNLLSPLAADLHARGDHMQLRRTLCDATRWVTAVACCIAVPAAIFAEPFLRAWVGPELVVAAPVLALLVLSIAAAMPQLVASAMMSMSGFHRRTGLLAAAMALSNLLLSLALVGPLGLLGPALATAICVGVYDLIVAPVLVCEAFDVRRDHYYKKSLMPVIPLAGLGAVLAITLQTFLPPSTMIEVLLCGGVTALVMMLAAASTGIVPIPERIKRRLARPGLASGAS